MRPRDKGRLEFPLPIERTRDEIDHEFRCDAEPGGAAIRRLVGLPAFGGEVPGDAENPRGPAPWRGHHPRPLPKEIGEFAYADLKKEGTLKMSFSNCRKR